MTQKKQKNQKPAKTGTASQDPRHLTAADLSDVNFSTDDLTGAELAQAKLNRANMKETNLTGADLSGAKLNRASLAGANLEGVDLHEAELTETDLRGANLHDSDLHDANLEGANLTGVDLECARDVRGARLGGARGLSDDQRDRLTAKHASFAEPQPAELADPPAS